MRLIDTEEVIKAVDKHTFETKDGLCLDDDITCILEEVPTIEERKTGMWIEVGTWTDMYTAEETPIFKCSVCGNEVIGTNGFDFCPHCGVYMRGYCRCREMIG